jgi:hypothetical protein
LSNFTVDFPPDNEDEDDDDHEEEHLHEHEHEDETLIRYQGLSWLEI